MNTYNNDFWSALDELVLNSEIVIDRPKGTAHPKYPNFIYRLDYGYLKNTSSMDGDGIDVWVGSGEQKIDAIMCIVDLMKRDFDSERIDQEGCIWIITRYNKLQKIPWNMPESKLSQG